MYLLSAVFFVLFQLASQHVNNLLTSRVRTWVGVSGDTSVYVLFDEDLGVNVKFHTKYEPLLYSIHMICVRNGSAYLWKNTWQPW